MMNFSILEFFSYHKWEAFRGYFDENQQIYQVYVVKMGLFEAILQQYHASSRGFYQVVAFK